MPGLGQGGQTSDPGMLAQVLGSLHQQSPNLLSQLLGGGGNLLSNPAVKSALGSIAAMAAKQFFSQRH